MDSRQLEKFAYKILADLLGLEVLIFFFVLLMEGVAPGYISGFLSFTKIILLLSATLFALVFLDKKIEPARPDYIFSKNKTAAFLAILGIILIANSMFGLGWLEILAVVAATIFILYLFWQIIFAEK